MEKFINWMRLRELSTSTACVPTFAMPVGGMERRISPTLITVDDLERKKKEKVKKEQYQPLANREYDTGVFKPDETIPVQRGEVLPSSEINPRSYSGKNKDLFAKILAYYREHPYNEDVLEILIKAQNGEDLPMIQFAQERRWV